MTDMVTREVYICTSAWGLRLRCERIWRVWVASVFLREDQIRGQICKQMNALKTSET